jgi:hypothetical protein
MAGAGRGHEGFIRQAVEGTMFERIAGQGMVAAVSTRFAKAIKQRGWHDAMKPRVAAPCKREPLTGDRIKGTLGAPRTLAPPATAGTLTPARERNSGRCSAAAPAGCRPPALPLGHPDPALVATLAARSRAGHARATARQMAGRASWKNGQGCRPHDEAGDATLRRRSRVEAPRADRGRPVRPAPPLLAPGIKRDAASRRSKPSDHEPCRDAAPPWRQT